MKRKEELEATIVAKYVAVAPMLDERSRRRWAAAESRAIAYGGDALVAAGAWLRLGRRAGLARETIRKGRREIARRRRVDGPHSGRRERGDPGFRRTNPAFSPRLRGLWTR